MKPLRGFGLGMTIFSIDMYSLREFFLTLLSILRLYDAGRMGKWATIGVLKFIVWMALMIIFLYFIDKL